MNLQELRWGQGVSLLWIKDLAQSQTATGVSVHHVPAAWVFALRTALTEWPCVRGVCASIDLCPFRYLLSISSTSLHLVLSSHCLLFDFPISLFYLTIVISISFHNFASVLGKLMKFLKKISHYMIAKYVCQSCVMLLALY